jgi:hypothetical protein
MGLFKSIGNVVKSVTKPLKKVIKSPLGRAALLGGIGYYGGQAGMFGKGIQNQGWKKFIGSKLPAWAYTPGTNQIAHHTGSYKPAVAAKGVLPAIGKFAKSPAGIASIVGGTALAAGPKFEEEIDIDVDSTVGDADYRRLAEYYEPEWEEWLLSQGYSADDAARLANERIFSSEGGRIGLRVGGGKGMSETQDTGMPVGGSGANYGAQRGDHGPRRGDHHPPAMRDEGILSKTRSNLIKGRAERELMNRMGLANRGNLWGILGRKSPDLWARQTGNPHLDYTEEDINRITEVQDYFNQGQGNFNITQDQYYDIFPKDKPPIDTGGGGGEGQPYIWPPRNVGGVSSAVTENAKGDGDYYAFKEWEDWNQGPTTPMFGNAYRGVLSSKGGRIGLYAGGMGAMNQGMNPMTMNQGIGSMNAMGMGSPRSQMMGQQQDPRMAKMNQMQNINRGIQSVKPPTQSEDAELIQLIKLLTSMGIPMEQLRGRTKEELVELVVSVKGKMEGGQDVKETAEVIEEEDIREQNQAAGGGLMRTGYAIGSSQFGMTAGPEFSAEDKFSYDMRKNLIEKLGQENPGASIDELYEMLKAQYGLDRAVGIQEFAQGGLPRTGYAMGTSQFGLMGNEHPVIPSKDGQQLDMRDKGGYQPHGKAEKHDDVRALLAQGEFVMTSDAVKGMGGGDRELGAKKMYDLMHNMEAMA